MGYAYQATVTVPAPTGGPHTDFTFLLKGSDTLLRLASLGTGGAIQNSTTRSYTGYTQTVPADCILTTDAAGTAIMTWGIDNWDSATGVIWMWVKIASYSAGFTIYVSIGNPLVTLYQGGSIGDEFRSSLKLTSHFPPGSGTLSAADFTVNGNSGAVSSISATTGQIDGAGVGDGVSGHYINFGHASSLDIPNSVTLSAWINIPTYGGTRAIAAKRAGSGDVNFGMNYTTTNWQWYYKISSGFQIQTIASSNIATGTWYYIVAVFEQNGANTTARFYRNGALLVGPTALTGNVPTSVGIDLIAFATTTTTENSPATIDELRIGSGVLSADWIATEYANQFSPPAMGAFAPISSGSVRSLALLGCGT